MSLRKLRVFLLRVALIPVIFVAVFIRPSWGGRGTTVEVVTEVVGYVLLLAGLSIRIWSIIYIGGKKSEQLVTEGPYSLCRHPLYVGTMVVTAGAGLCLENLPLLVLMLVGMLPVHFVVAGQEDKHLASLFPGEYEDYARRVPLFWPRFRGYRAGESVTIPTRAIRRIAMDTVAVMLIPVAEELIELFQHQGVLPVLWRFP